MVTSPMGPYFTFFFFSFVFDESTHIYNLVLLLIINVLIQCKVQFLICIFSISVDCYMNMNCPTLRTLLLIIDKLNFSGF